MRPHAVVTLRPQTAHAGVVSWVELAMGGGPCGPPFQPDIDTVLARRRLDVAIVHEYLPADAEGWTPAERAAGLDRQFRIISFGPPDALPPAVAELSRLAVVAGARSAAIATTPLPAATMSRRPSDWTHDAIALAEAHRVVTGDPRVIVAVLDTGIDPRHREYADRLVGGFDMVDIIDGAAGFIGDRVGADPDPSDPGVGHGSHVTGIVAGRGLRMPIGVAPGCRVMPVRVLGALRQGDGLIGAGLVDNINAGIKWAVDHGASVINMSLGIQHTGGGLPHAEVTRYARSRGVAVVAAAGNDGTQTLYYPGALPHVLAVGAVDRDGAVASYSTWGRQVSVVAPGTEIWSSWLDGGYAFATGTSQATPFVAGTLALCQSMARLADRRFTPAELAGIVSATADRDGTRFRERRSGFGRLNARDAVTLAAYRIERGRPTATSDRPRGALAPV